MAIVPNPVSRNLGVPVVRDAAGRELFDIRIPAEFELVEGIERVEIRSSDTLHSLSSQFYGTAHLWWFIADFNGIFDPTTELATKRVVLVPPLDLVKSFLLRPVG